MRENIANRITYSRFFLGLLMLISLYYSSLFFFVFSYVFALITDILDGFFARKFRIESEYGKKLDIFADNFILFCVIIGIYVFQKDFFLKTTYYFFIVFIYYIIIQLISLLKTKKLIFMRTYAANLTAFVFPFFVILILFFKSREAVLAYSILMVYSLTEKIFLHILKKKHTIFYTKSIRQVALFFFIFLMVSTSFFFQKQESEVCFNEKCINIDVMDTPEKRALGLMYRQRLSEEEGMLFIFETPLVTSFWMKNVQFSIDIIFIDENKTIAHIEKNVPPCYEDPCPLYSSLYEVKYVVEVVAGFSDTYNIKKGEKIKIN